MAGALTGGWQGWGGDVYPPDPFEVAEGARGDASMARELVEHFGIDRVDWGHVVWKAERLCRGQDFRRLVVRIARELERVEVLTAEDLEELMSRDSERSAA